MPVMNGIEATAEIRKINSEIPIIAQIAYASDNDRKKALSSGCKDVISKPVNKTELIAKINNYLKYIS